MKSKWSHLKNDAIGMRTKGISIREIERSLQISRSTLSGWLKNIKLSEKQLDILEKNRLKALVQARRLAMVWHNQQKQLRLKKAEEQASKILNKININNKSVLELALSMLYLGEGYKKGSTSIGNSDPLILKFFISALKKVYNYDVTRIKCELHLRADQNPKIIRKYWVKQLNIPLTNFTSISIDQRTAGFPTYSTYKGVCILQCGNVALQRRLVYLSQGFCEKVANLRAVSSAGRASA